jgi:predicted metal-dependent phosphoesterase TrpH
VAISYRRAGFDFMCLTDHHRYAPSLEARDAVIHLTDAFTVFPGEEVHNKDMGYIHIVNFGGGASVNDIIENDPDYVKERLAAIGAAVALPDDVDPATTIFRLFITEEIRRAGGLAVLAHPFWNTGGEYSMESAEMIYHLKNGSFDALELLASDDHNGNGDNLQVALYYALRDEGVRTPVLGASDRHDPEKPTSLFNRHFSLVFAERAAAIPDAVRRGMSVAVNRRTDDDFFVFGDYRLVKYARFLLSEFYPHYATLTAAHADGMEAANGTRTEAIIAAEAEIRAFRTQFFAE